MIYLRYIGGCIVRLVSVALFLWGAYALAWIGAPDIGMRLYRHVENASDWVWGQVLFGGALCLVGAGLYWLSMKILPKRLAPQKSIARQVLNGVIFVVSVAVLIWGAWYVWYLLHQFTR